MKRFGFYRLFSTIPKAVATTDANDSAQRSQSVRPPAPILADRAFLRRRVPQWTMIALILLLTVPVAAQMVGRSQTVQQSSRERVQVAQTPTIAVCGETCNCGSSRQVSKQEAPCTVNSTAGSCTTGSGECCVCATPNTTAVCDEEMCNCGDAVMITQVPAPCMVTSTNGQCQAGTGACCICAAN